MGWRLLDSGVADPYVVTAADDAIAEARKINNVPNTLHFYQRKNPTISLGRSRSIKKDVNLKECSSHHITIIRRTTGGGTIFTDKGCLIYSLAFDHQEYTFPHPEQLFETICGSIATALSSFQIPTTYKPPNDLLISGKKISGAAQIQKQHTTLIHGTILVHTNLALMNSVLCLPTCPPVTTLAQECTTPPTIPEIKKAMQYQFKQVFNTTFTPSQFTKYEQQLIQQLLKKRYHNPTWNFHH